MIKRRRWTKDEEEYLRKNYNKKRTTDICKKLNRTKRSIYRKTEEMKISIDNKEKFQNILKSSEVKVFEDKNIYYFLAGFTAGEGSFVKYSIKKNCRASRHGFIVGLAIDDEDVLKLFKKELGVGNIYYSKSKNPKHKDIVAFSVQSSLLIYTHVIPFMNKFLVCSRKKKQFEVWKKDFFDKYNIKQQQS